MRNSVSVICRLTRLTRNCGSSEPRKAAWDVRGKLHAEIVQACIVTGEPVSESVDFEIEERYVLASVPEDEIVVDLGDAEPLVNGCIDLGGNGCPDAGIVGYGMAAE